MRKKANRQKDNRHSQLLNILIQKKHLVLLCLLFEVFNNAQTAQPKSLRQDLDKNTCASTNHSARIPFKSAGDLDGQGDVIGQSVTCTMKKFRIPGGQLAVSRNGKIVYSGAYGFSDLNCRTPVETNSIFRIASLSKIITATAVMKLVEQGKLSPEQRAFTLLPEMLPHSFDQRLLDITVSDLLNMTAGWDLKKRGEVLFVPRAKKIADHTDSLMPPPLESVCHHELAGRLDWDPGSHFSYSNLAYALLGRIISKVSGTSYLDFCRTELFVPLEIVNIFPAGRRISDRLQQEVIYYPEEPGKCKKSMFTQDFAVKMPAPYGRIDIERYTSSFGWAGNAEAILKFIDAAFCTNAKLENSKAPDCKAPASPRRLLNSTSVAQMLARTRACNWIHSAGYVASACDISNDYSRGKATIFKDGTLSGTRTFLICYPDGISCCALFNARPRYTRKDPFRAEMMKVFAKVDQIYRASH